MVDVNDEAGHSDRCYNIPQKSPTSVFTNASYTAMAGIDDSGHIIRHQPVNTTDSHISQIFKYIFQIYNQKLFKHKQPIKIYTDNDKMNGRMNWL